MKKSVKQITSKGSPLKLKKVNVVEVETRNKVKKEPHLRVFQSIRLYFREYCEKSSLHGIRYLGEKYRTLTERFWWLLIFIASFYMCSQLILKTWTKWNQNPLIVNFAETLTSVYEIPFPAVTICSETKTRQRIYNFTDAYLKWEHEWSEMTDKELKQFSDVSLLCFNHIGSEGNKIVDQSTINFIHEIAPDLEEMLWQCKWINIFGPNSDSSNCTPIFSPTLTDEGLCFTFNMLQSSEVLKEEAQNKNYLHHGKKSQWSLDKGYDKGSGMKVYPERAFGAGYQAGLNILLRSNYNDLDYLCRGAVQGFKITLHNPEEMPRMSQQSFRVPLNQEVTFTVQPDMITTSEGLKDYHPNRRHCYFPNEKVLRYFKVYTQQNCEIECLTNYTYKMCKCVAYYMPRANITSICGSGSMKCVAIAQDVLLLDEVESNINQQEDSKKCNCLPACTSLKYNAETTQTDLNWRIILTGEENPEISKNVLSRVHIHFKSTQFLTKKRSELYSQTDFLANCGGLLSLFIGFSVLSFIEIIYFLTLRLWCNIRTHGRRMWNAEKIDNLQGKTPNIIHVQNKN